MNCSVFCFGFVGLGGPGGFGAPGGGFSVLVIIEVVASHYCN